MHPKNPATLELPKILERVAALGAFSASRELLLNLQPETSLAHVRAMQAATSEALRMLAGHPSLTIGGAHDVRPLAGRATLGAILSAAELLDILATIDSARTMRELLHRGQLVYPELATFAGRLHAFKGLREDIADTVNEHGEVVDSASPQLSYLRREVRAGRDRIMRRLEAMIADPNNAEAIQEPIVTERNGRYVIAVKATHRDHIRGVVHDQSESGATLFLEPLATVDMTNDWRQRQLDEQKEVERILRVL
ncbi:MAG TPA: endonuclease MutS2, partial [Chloroflexota bacterium]